MSRLRRSRSRRESHLNIGVAEVGPTRDFFCTCLDFKIVTEVTHGDAVGFAILSYGDVEVMIQSNASIADDMAQIAGLAFRSLLYIDVPNVKALRERLTGSEEIIPLRTTFYGADELFVREPGGNIIGLSSPAATA